VYFMFQSACVLVYVLVTPVCLTEMIIKEATLYLLKFKGNVGVAQCDGTRLSFRLRDHDCSLKLFKVHAFI